jgi:hypothetical protein
MRYYRDKDLDGKWPDIYNHGPTPQKVEANYGQLARITRRNKTHDFWRFRLRFSRWNRLEEGFRSIVTTLWQTRLRHSLDRNISSFLSDLSRCTEWPYQRSVEWMLQISRYPGRISGASIMKGRNSCARWRNPARGECTRFRSLSDRCLTRSPTLGRWPGRARDFEWHFPGLYTDHGKLGRVAAEFEAKRAAAEKRTLSGNHAFPRSANRNGIYRLTFVGAPIAGVIQCARSAPGRASSTRRTAAFP